MTVNTSWLHRLLAITTLLGWLGAAYHDVLLDAVEVAHDHQHAQNHIDENRNSHGEESDDSTSLPDFHNVDHLTKSKKQSNPVTPPSLVSHIFALWMMMWQDWSFDTPQHSSLPEINDCLYQPNVNLLAHSVHPNAPPMFA